MQICVHPRAIRAYQRPALLSSVTFGGLCGLIRSRNRQRIYENVRCSGEAILFDLLIWLKEITSFCYISR